MTVNSIDWPEAQELLVKLVQILSSVSEPISIQERPYLNHRFFIPPKGPALHPFYMRQPVTILKTLHSIKNQVDLWVNPDLSLNGNLSEPKEGKSVATQAKRLVNEVQKTIAQFCTSSHIKNPNREPLQEVFRGLQPKINRMVASIIASETSEREDVRNPIPIPMREKKLRELTGDFELKFRDLPKVEREKEFRETSTQKILTKLVSKNNRGSQSLSYESLSSQTKEGSDKLSSFTSVLKDEQITERVVDKKVPPLLSLIMAQRPLAPSRKLKKDQKYFRFREDDELEDE